MELLSKAYLGYDPELLIKQHALASMRRFRRYHPHLPPDQRDALSKREYELQVQSGRRFPRSLIGRQALGTIVSYGHRPVINKAGETIGYENSVTNFSSAAPPKDWSEAYLEAAPGEEKRLMDILGPNYPQLGPVPEDE